MKTITPNLWCDGNAKEVADFYTSVFPDGKMGNIMYYPKTKEEGLADFQQNMAGKELTVEFTLGDMPFVLINAGPEFKFNPSVSFMVNFDPSNDSQAQEKLDDLWSKLMEGGKALMDIGEYPYSKRYGWVQDKFGVSWQLMLTMPGGDTRPFIVPSLMFTENNTNKAREAIDFYLSVFKDAKLGSTAEYPEDSGTVKKGSLMFADFWLEGQWFAAMDAGEEHKFSFDPAISFSIPCEDQAEIDYYWERLSKDPEFEQCGWCKDQYGVTWQVVPKNVVELLKRPNAYPNMMKMHKLVIADF